MKNQSEIAAEARDVLVKFDYSTPPFNAFDIARGEGFEIKLFEPSDDKEYIGSDVSGLSKCYGDEKVIYLNENESKQRQHFTVAHELGHYYLNHQKDRYVVYRRTNRNKTLEEKEADYFAGALLMPKVFIRNAIRTYNMDPVSRYIGILADIFGVSKSAMTTRLKQLGYGKKN